MPVAHGISMLHARSVDPATGVVYNWKPGTGYQYLEPEAVRLISCYLKFWQFSL